jgi:hypothetical protein
LAYIGNIPAESYASFETETFSVSATANYTLSHAVTNENEIRLVINGVVQQPGSGKAYTASGTTLTLTSATVSGDVMYAVYLGRALQTVNPPNASVGTAQLGSSLDFSSKTITLASNMKNTPAFEAKRSANQTASDGAWTKMQLNTELYDSGDYDNSTNFRFTPTVAGKYYVYINAYHNPSSTANLYDYAVAIYKNGSEADGAAEFIIDTEGTTGITEVAAQTGVRVIDMNGSTDYLEFYFFQSVSGGTPTISGRSFAGAYRLIGV